MDPEDAGYIGAGAAGSEHVENFGSGFYTWFTPESENPWVR